MPRRHLEDDANARYLFPRWDPQFTPSHDAWQRYVELKSARQSLKPVGFGFIGLSLGGALAFVSPGEWVIAKVLFVFMVCVVAIAWDTRHFLKTRAARLALEEDHYRFVRRREGVD